MATSISMINMKGGVGKTTLAFNFIWYLAYECELKVLAVDLDPQSNLSQYLMGATKYLKFLQAGSPSIVDIFEQFSAPTLHQPSPTELDMNQLIHSIRHWNDGSRIDLIPSRLELSWTLKNPTDKSHLLARCLAKVSDEYDVILIDCAPTESMLTTAAYRSSRYLVVPVRPEFLSTIGLPLLARSIAEFHARFGDQQLEIAGIVVNDGSSASPDSSKAIKDLKILCSNQGWPIIQGRVPRSDSFPRGARESTPIFQTKYAQATVKNRFLKIAERLAEGVDL